MARILVVEDEEPISNILKFSLERDGHTVSCAYDGNEAIREAKHFLPDLVLLDIMLPEKDGFEVLREIRTFSATPVIMLTARDSEVDKVLGLELGADDYVTKPFSTRELLARVKANIRRKTLDAEENGLPDTKNSNITFDDIVIDFEHYEVRKHEETIALTVREFQLLSILASRPGLVYTRDQLLMEVWGMDYVGDERTVDVTVRRLREKLEDDPSNPEYVLTRRGVGYFLRR